jgi:hypothetical protein
MGVPLIMSTTQNGKPAQLRQRLIRSSLKTMVELKDRNALSVSLGAFDVRVPDGVVVEHVTGDCTHAMVLKTGLRLDCMPARRGRRIWPVCRQTSSRTSWRGWS